MILKLDAHLSPRIWGGEKLKEMKKIDPNSIGEMPIGETWEISTHKEGTSKIQSTKEDLSKFFNLNFLVKFLDTSDVLSVQVHPEDYYASIHENDKGKNECWLILDAAPGAGIYLGFKEGITKTFLREALERKEDISQYLNFYPVKKGDFYFVTAGTIHAIGAGITLIEVQQSSGVTYRVWDWNRVDKNGKGRELHVDKSFDVLVDHPSKNNLDFFQHKKNVLELDAGKTILARDRDFHLELIFIPRNEEINLNLDMNVPYGLVVIEGQAQIESQRINQYDSFIISNEKQIQIKASQDLKFALIR